MGHAVARGKSGQHQVCPWCGQVAHAHGRDAKGAICGGPEKRGCKRAIGHIAQDAGPQCYRIEGGTIARRPRFTAGRAVDIIKHQPRQTALGNAPRVLCAMDVACAHQAFTASMKR